MSSATKRVLISIWHKRWSPELWLLASNVLSRLLGFVVSLLVSRLLGVQALGMYSGLLVTTASPTTPMASALANNATMLSSRGGGLRALPGLLRAHGLVLLASAGVAYTACLAMLYSVALHDSVNLAWSGVALVAAVLVLGQLLTPFLMGLAHGLNLSLGVAMVTMIWTGLALLLVYPVVLWFGLSGALWQAALVGLLPALTLIAWMLWRTSAQRAEQQAVRLQHDSSEAWKYFKLAIPSMGATVLNNGVNWLACIYLAERFHGSVGVGLVAIGLQWMALMLLPLTSWNGRVMRALAVSHAESAQAFQGALRIQVRRCLLITLLTSGLVVACTPWIASLYRVEEADLWGLVLINGLAACFFAVVFVYERACFCLGIQRTWLWVSGGAYLVQLVLTWWLIPQAIWMVAMGNLVANALLMLVIQGQVRRAVVRPVAGRQGGS